MMHRVRRHPAIIKKPGRSYLRLPPKNARFDTKEAAQSALVGCVDASDVPYVFHNGQLHETLAQRIMTMMQGESMCKTNDATTAGSTEKSNSPTSASPSAEAAGRSEQEMTVEIELAQHPYTMMFKQRVPYRPETLRKIARLLNEEVPC